MNGLQCLIDQAYEDAKAGNWRKLLADWQSSGVLVDHCSRYINPDSNWGFLHHAAYFGNEEGSRILISRGAFVDALAHDSCTPAEIAEQRGYRDLAAFLRDASTGRSSLWVPPADPGVRPSSNRWHEAKEAVAGSDLLVAYGSRVVRIPKGESYFVDSLERVLIGWHGTFNPPCGMDGEAMIAHKP